ncbi:LLM class flavin-dependent oxidoreductase [Capillimicrobium parvum]|uniref:Luciferase-like domain-containing protein n=1 Tax=Capillimicrobium parvum TaxID=2884022 RepID=A0A9E6Y3E9_9ACTN|nr:LLM class flavin-dependent oxidoreductase [Capillimicrobium parvum]UGS38981.1 hypothetical protein DSM104329_05413 [Capillimicrobium parvum]
MKFNLFMLPTIPGSLADRERLRPIARNSDRWQMMLHEVRELAILADELGFDSVGTTEHHFHSEGLEVSVAPLLLYADLAVRTKRIKFMPNSIVLPGNDPIRVAEQMAYLDHLTKGRFLASFARGYQSRWVNILGQQIGVEAATMDGSDVDKHNRAVHEEYLDIIIKAWTEDLLRYKGRFYEVPSPYEKGISPKQWPVSELTAKYGAPGEIGEDGYLRGVSVCPAPYQRPHPPLFQAFGMSGSTMTYTAERDIIPMILTSYPDNFRALCETYRDHAALHGRELRLGESVGAMRSITIHPDRQRALQLVEDGGYFVFDLYFGGFGFWDAFRMPGDEERWPKGKSLIPKSEWTMDRFTRSKYAIAGTPDEVKRDVEALHRVHADGQLDWLTLLFDQGVMSLDDAKQQLEWFAEHIISEFGETGPDADEPAAAVAAR